MSTSSSTAHLQVTAVEITHAGLHLSVRDQSWRLTREATGAQIAQGSCETFEGAVFAGTMEARLHEPTFNMRMPLSRSQ